jgi:hypothetical protein
MLMGLEIAMLVWGVVLLISGRAGFSRNAATGPLVRTAGFILMLPMAVGFVVAYSMRMQGSEPEQAVSVASTVELIAMLAAGTISILLCLNAPRSPHAGA